MKRYITYSTFILTLSSFSLIGYSQTSDIISDTKEFDYLKGIEYSDVSELDELVYKTKTGMTKDKVEITSTNFIKGNYQIITSESVRHDLNSNQKVYTIQDLIVLKGYYALCGGCLISDDKNVTIRSVHPIGNKKREVILLAFERNNSTGVFKQVDPTHYRWNPNADRLERN